MVRKTKHALSLSQTKRLKIKNHDQHFEFAISTIVYHTLNIVVLFVYSLCPFFRTESS